MSLEGSYQLITLLDARHGNIITDSAAILSPSLPSYSSLCVYLQYNPIKTIKTNTKGTLNMLGMAKRVGVRLCLRVSYYFAIVIYSFLW